MSKCKGCQAEIVWIKTVNGKNMPCNAEKTTIVTESGETIIGHIPHCLTDNEIENYLGNKDGYGLHISDLKIYDKPKKISKFWSVSGDQKGQIQRPPQSWCYVEV